MSGTLSPGEVVGQRVAELRREREWTQHQLVKRLRELGVKMDRATLARIERGGQRAQNITLKEVYALAVALDEAPIDLLAPQTAAAQEMWITPAFFVDDLGTARDWLQGDLWLSYYPHPEGLGGEFFEVRAPDVASDDERKWTAGNRDYQRFFRRKKRSAKELS